MQTNSLFSSLKTGVGVALCAMGLVACGGGSDESDSSATPSQPVVFAIADAPAKLSQWNAVLSAGNSLSHNAAVVPYDLSSALFSDYSLKMRALYVPAGKQINYSATGTLDFPVGTAIYKTFYFPRAKGTDPANYLPVGKQTSAAPST
jgi:hypothetical protein